MFKNQKRSSIMKKKFLYAMVILFLVLSAIGMNSQSAQASAQPSTTLLNADKWYLSNDGGGECDDDDHGNNNGQNRSTTNNNGNNNDGGDDDCECGHEDDKDCDDGTPTSEPTVEVTVTRPASTGTTVPKTPTIYVPTQTPTKVSTATPTDEPTVNPPTATPTKDPESTATQGSTLTPQSSAEPDPSATPSPTPPVKQEEEEDDEDESNGTVKRAASTKLIPVTGSAPVCDHSDKILSDNGEDIFWFDTKLESKINITEGLGGLNTHGSFDPVSECPRMVFLHANNAGSAPEIWIYDGEFYAIQNKGESIQANVVRWSAKDLIAFVADGYLKHTSVDGSVVTDLDMYGVNMIDWSPNGEILAVTNDDHALFFMNSLGEIMATASNSYMSDPKWMSDQSQICSGERCIYIETLTEGSFVVNKDFAHYIAFNPADGAQFVLSDNNRMAIYQTESFVEGVWMNLDWFSINKAPRLPIRLGQENLCMSFEDSNFTGTSIVDFMLITPGFTSADWSREGRKIWMDECGVDNNYDLLLAFLSKS
jgi:hypothetical protein